MGAAQIKPSQRTENHRTDAQLSEVRLVAGFELLAPTRLLASAQIPGPANRPRAREISCRA
jgi:hypothetical protein